VVTHCAAVPLTSVLTVFVNVILPAVMNVAVLMRCAMVGSAYSVLREGLYAMESVAGKVPDHAILLLVSVHQEVAAQVKRCVKTDIAVALLQPSVVSLRGVVLVST